MSFGTQYGLNRYDLRFQWVSLTQGLSQTSVSSITQDNQGAPVDPVPGLGPRSAPGACVLRRGKGLLPLPMTIPRPLRSGQFCLLTKPNTLAQSKCQCRCAPMVFGIIPQLSRNPQRASKRKSQLPRWVAVPTQNSERPQCIPAACPADAALQLQWNMFGMKEVKRPATILVAALDHGFDGVTDTAIWFDSCIPQIIESAQDIVVPKRREREAEPAFVDDFAGSKRPEHASLEQIVFGPLARLRDGHRFAPCSFVIEESFEHADGGVERRAPALGCFAVPAAILELLAQKSIGQCVVGFFEIRADGKNSTVDAGLRFAVKERPVVEPLKHEPLVDAVDHFVSLLAGGVETEVLQDDESVEGNQHASVLFGQIVSPPAGALAPVASRRLGGEELGSPAFGCDARPLGCNRAGGFAGKVPHDLPTDGRVRIEEPFEVRGPGRIIV
jgi:hypothetical protein